MDKKQVKSIADVEAKKEVKAHESRMHKGAKNFRAGGKTNADMKSMGRGLAKVANQKSVVRKVRATGI
jgi:hypothetical protein